jgi:fluoroacetyl-CoA thioesterase
MSWRERTPDLSGGGADGKSNSRWSVMVDLTLITPGLTGTAQLLVGPEHTAPFVGSGHVAVLATPVMINVIEAAALNAIEQLLPSGHQSLGIHLDVGHVAATPVGLRVTATATVLRVEGRTITFQVQARDDVEVIGSGIHKRVVVSVVRFDERLQRKVRGQR